MTDAVPILIVEDEDRQRDTLLRHLTRDGFDAVGAPSAETALELLSERSFGAMVTDYRLPGIDGLELVRRAHDLDEEMPTIVMTAFASIDTAVEALRAGASDYVLKPLFFDELSRKLRRALEHRALLRENAGLRRAVRESSTKHEYIGTSAAAQRVRDWIERAAPIEATVLITGETGTGKEIIARAIHDLGPRSSEPMLTINVAALAPNMIESELFGHEKGAYTGAHGKREGILRAAGGGTVFLDEIGELSLELQAKLLRALEAREVQPIGSDRAVPFEARILCATHRDLRRRITDELFREDLYYRLNVVLIESPPMRSRREDIPAIAHHLCERTALRTGVEPPVLDPTTVRALCTYSWPGNVRELANVIERAMILTDGGRLEPEHLPVEIESEDEEPVADLRDATDAFERRHIARVLRDCSGNRDRAAKLLGLSPATLYRRLDKLDLKGDRANEVEP